MKRVVALMLGMAAALVAVNALGIASAEAPTTSTPLRALSVEGVGTSPIAQEADATVADAAYRQAMAAAMADGQSKAEFLAGKAAATLGSVQDIGESGGSVQCHSGSEAPYPAYEGEEPDFGSATAVSEVGNAPTFTPEVAPVATTHSVKKRKKRKKHVAKAAAAVSCTVYADITLVYQLS